MALRKLTATFSNTTKVDGENESFLYRQTTNAGNFVITPNAGATFKPVTNPPELGSGTLDPGGSVLYVRKLEDVMDAAAVAVIQFGADWNARYYPKDGSDGGYWAISPKTATSVSANQDLTIPVTNVTVGDGKGLPFFTARITYYDVDGITSEAVNHNDANFSIALRNAPDAPMDKLSKYVSASFANGYEMDWGGYSNVEMVRTTIDGETVTPNSFTLVIAPILGQVAPKVTEQTVFRLSFPVSHDKFGALASPTDLSQMRITSDYGWDVQPHPDEAQPFWVVKIPAGRSISGSLTFSNVISHLEEGFAPIMLHWEAVPGCEDGEYRLPMYKFGPPRFLEGSVTIDGPDGEDPWMIVYWNTENVSRVIVEINDKTLADDEFQWDNFTEPTDGDIFQTIVISGVPFDSDASKRIPIELFRKTLELDLIDYVPFTYYLP